MTSIIDYAEYWWFSFSSYPLVVKIAICVIVFSSAVTLLLMARIFIVRRNKKRKREIITRLRPQLFSFLRNIILSRDIYTGEDVHTLYEQQFGRLEKRAYLSLIPALEDVVFQEKGTLDSDNYNSVIIGLKINKCLEERLDSSSKRMQLLALQALSRLGLTVADSKILPYAYSNDKVLRKESRASYMGVSNNNPFKFFDEEDTFNEWEEINLMQQFEMHHKDHLPDFSKWIRYSEDDEKIKFFIRQAAYFNQQTALSTIVAILQHDDYRVRKEAIIAIGKLNAADQESKLINLYFSQPLVCQFAIIEAVSFLNTGNSLEFLKNAYELSGNPDLKRLSAEAIYFYGDQGRELFEVLLKTESAANKKILEHVQNKLITSTLKTFHGFAKSYDQNVAPGF
ncbi:HEAT repeat domain-containing protein [Flavobacterium sp. DG1-102-2]|uniref:HEAT repeat domain-containing protein n=1 Tax=Flavobacterium sp. DG1-102-2 TaxID=3081663 RepID=UPI002948DCB7|nr:HEAT repeat domain-containing protein [Flavobacterium sp. DG1-102-2]MDV6170365.1 HEAT repeat domain-containing protein [Flavobacterium sp. DG1-102-2]